MKVVRTHLREVELPKFSAALTTGPGDSKSWESPDKVDIV